MSHAGANSNTATLHRFHSAMNSGDPDVTARAVDEFVAPDLRFHAPLPLRATGSEALKKVWQTLLQAFPDLHVTVEETIEEDDKVVSRNTVTGTHLGDYRGLPPTGRAVAYSEIFIFRFVDGRIAEVRGVVDVLSQLRQLGALPS